MESSKEKGEEKALELENEVIALRKEVEALETLFITRGKHEKMKPEDEPLSQTWRWNVRAQKLKYNLEQNLYTSQVSLLGAACARK